MNINCAQLFVTEYKRVSSNKGFSLEDHLRLCIEWVVNRDGEWYVFADETRARKVNGDWEISEERAEVFSSSMAAA